MSTLQFAYAKLPARDVERARRFYATALDVHPYSEGDGHLYYDVNGCRFMIYASAGTPSGNHDQLGFVVDDIATALTELRGAGIEPIETPATIDGVADFGPVRAAWFHDSEGNLLNLIEGTSPLWHQ
jgi:predicted enzyme related to lactoylglutathione lyase